MPSFPWLAMPSTHRYVAKFRLECNYLQAMEGDYDPSHAAFLHMTSLEKRYSEAMDAGDLNVNTVAGGAGFTDPASWGDIEDTAAGVLCTSVLQRSDGSYNASAGALWMMPAFCAGAVANTGLHTLNIRIPIDNTSLMFFRLRWSRQPLSVQDLHEYKAGGYYYPAMLPGTDKPVENSGNDYQVDRLAQKTYSYSGIKSFPAQDAAVVENQTGPIADRRREHLVASDAHIIHIRRRLLRTVKALVSGDEPSEPWHPETYGVSFGASTAPTREAALDRARRQAMTGVSPDTVTALPAHQRP
jgi:hypothetical protein